MRLTLYRHETRFVSSGLSLTLPRSHIPSLTKHAVAGHGCMCFCHRLVFPLRLLSLHMIFYDETENEVFCKIYGYAQIERMTSAVQNVPVPTPFVLVHE